MNNRAQKQKPRAFQQTCQLKLGQMLGKQRLDPANKPTAATDNIIKLQISAENVASSASCFNDASSKGLGFQS